MDGGSGTRTARRDAPRTLVRVLGVGAVLLALFGGVDVSASAAGATRSRAPTDTFVTDGYVTALAGTADAIYLGGNFDSVGPRTGPFATLRTSTDQADAAFPEVSGGLARVEAAAADGAGGWYLGGDFTHVGGVPRRNLAHILASGKVDPNWAPEPTGGERPRTVQTIEPDGRGTVYVGGHFTQIAGVARAYAAAVAADTGELLAWDPHPDGPVRDLALGAGGIIYMAGLFSHINEAQRAGLAAVDPTVGQPSAWNPAPGGFAGPAVYELALAPDGIVYASGKFTVIGINRASRRYLAALDPVTAASTAWDPNPDDVLNDIAVSSQSVVYVGGVFTRIGRNGADRPGLAALDPQTADATGWNPQPAQASDGSTFVNSIAIGPTGMLYVGGRFGTIGANHLSRRDLAEIHPATAEATAWRPNPNFYVRTVIMAEDGTIAVAGGFTSVGGEPRRNLAALKASDGTLTSWAPDPDEQVTDISVAPGGTVYAAGSFNTIGATPVERNYLAALDPTTAEAKPWNPNPSSGVSAVEVGVDGTVYAGGFFWRIGANSASRAGLAALDAATGAATGWNPNPSNGLLGPAGGVSRITIGPGGGPIYVTGPFRTIGANQLSREWIAALDPETANATSWNPGIDGAVQDLAVGPDGTLYVGGNFNRIGANDAPRHDLAALDPVTGQARSWNPDPRQAGDAGVETVWGIAVGADGTVYVGGLFDTIGTNRAKRAFIAELDPATGAASDWNPGLEGHTMRVEISPTGAVLAAGSFRGAELAAQQGVASFGEPLSQPINVDRPTVNGRAAIGSELQCHPGSWSDTASHYYTYVWLRDGLPVTGATRTRYRVPASDGGHDLTCRVTAHNADSGTSADGRAVAIASLAASPQAETQTKPSISAAGPLPSTSATTPDPRPAQPVNASSPPTHRRAPIECHPRRTPNAYVLLVHGDRFTRGSPASHRRSCSWLAQRGMYAVAPPYTFGSYRRAELEIIRAARRLPHPRFAIGWSIGGSLAEAAVAFGALDGAVAIAAPSDYATWRDSLFWRSAGLTYSERVRLSPLRRLGPADRLLLMHAANDKIVPFTQSARLARRVRAPLIRIKGGHPSSPDRGITHAYRWLRAETKNRQLTHP